jgi:aldehyde dehydrogenase (NAD+)
METLQPLVSALAAGNTAILKPSELAIHSSAVIKKLINENFEEHIIHVIEGGVSETTEILQLPFDKIFFTGSSAVGKIIYKSAAEHLTPVTLELGGKSPAIICSDASLRIAAKRIVWGKFLNSGQTCVAPDYLLIEKKFKSKFITELKSQIQQIHGDDPIQSEGLTRIINDHHFDRLHSLIKKDQVIWGGNSNKEKLFIEPTLLDNVRFEDAIMQEEIFGPLLPLFEFDTIEEAIQIVKRQPKPLSLYLFTASRTIKTKVLSELSFGGGGINETVVQLGNHHLPFGGVGNSGMGNYHGKFGFDNFSHKKAIHEKLSWFEPRIKYPPFTDFKTKIIRWLLA